jgi:predicted DsbA family dithiol-disulfide isomerase
MNVEIWADIACPWCYIGKRRFEAALAQFAHRDQVEVTWRSYQLDPDAPRISKKTLNEVLAEKHGMSTARAVALNNQMTELAAKEGLEYHFERTRYGNSFDAHRLIHLAATHHLQGEMEERLFKAYFTEGAALGETETLVKLAVEAGLDSEEARAVLTGETYANEVRADTQRARQLGIGGVPFFAIDETYGISGAQPSAVLKEALERAWNESHPLIKVTGGTQDAGYCEGESCMLPTGYATGEESPTQRLNGQT